MRKCCYDSNNKKSKFDEFKSTVGVRQVMLQMLGIPFGFISSGAWFCVAVDISVRTALSRPLIEGCCEYFLAPFGKRSWKMFYCTLRDPLVMYLHKDERGFHKNQVS